MEKPLSWWVSNRDRAILGAAAIMFGLLVWSIPRQLEAMREEHQALYSSVQILCVHNAKDKDERRECLVGKLTQKTLDSLH
jgi:hypothetical protein